MRALRKREFPIYYAKGKKLFQIIVQMSDTPGSLGSILDLLGSKVNLVGSSTYTLGDGTAILSAFAEALSQEETGGSLHDLLESSQAIKEVEVREGQGGLLIDTFHKGLQVGNDEYIQLRRDGLSGVFDHIVKIFGTGGEVLLYEEGLALAQKAAEKTKATLTIGVINANLMYMVNLLSAQGWGTFEVKPGEGDHEYTIMVSDCFECSNGSEVRRGCDFMRGSLERSSGVTFGVPMQSEEPECILRGARACVFQIAPKKGKSR